MAQARRGQARGQGDPARQRRGPLAGGHAAASHPRGAPHRRHRHPRAARPQARRAGREFLAVPPLPVGRAGAPRRLAPLRARRTSLCARAGVGGRAYGVAVARSLALDGVHVAAGAGIQARSLPGRRLRARRGAGAGRRARRHAGPDAADRQPQRARQDGEGDRARCGGAAEPAADLCALGAGRDRGAVGFLEPDRGGAQNARAALGDRRARPCRADRRSGRGDLSLFRPRRVHRAGRRRLASPPAAPRPGRATTRRALRATAPKSAPRPTGSAGASPSIAPTGRRPNCCWRCMRAWARRLRARRSAAA